MNEQEFYANIGALIREFRKLRDLTQADFAIIMRVSANTISRWETATYHPSAFDLYRLADYFRVSPRRFYEPRSPMKSPDRVDLNTTIKRLRKERSGRAAKNAPPTQDVIELMRALKSSLGKRTKRTKGKR